MTDDQLAEAWESFATALREVPGRRMERYLLAAGMSHAKEDSARYQRMAMNAHMERAHQLRGVRGGLFGFGIMI